MRDNSKIKKAIAYIINYFQEHYSIENLGSVKLNKILWFCEENFIYKYNKPFLNLTFIKKEMGPVSNNIKDILDEMVEEFSNALKELKVDEYTKEPVKTKYGYHIIIKTGEKDKEALKDIKEDIKTKLKDRKLNNDSTLYYTTLQEIREANKIKWNDDVLKKAYNDYMEEIIEAAKKQATQQ